MRILLSMRRTPILPTVLAAASLAAALLFFLGAHEARALSPELCSRILAASEEGNAAAIVEAYDSVIAEGSSLGVLQHSDLIALIQSGEPFILTPGTPSPRTALEDALFQLSEVAALVLTPVQRDEVRALVLKRLRDHEENYRAGRAQATQAKESVNSAELFRNLGKLQSDAHFSPDGRWIFRVGSREYPGWGQDVRVWDSRTLGLAPVTNSKIYSAAAVSPDGRTLAVGDSNGKVELFELPSGTSIRVLHQNYVKLYDMFYSPSGKYLVLWDKNGQLRYWDVEALDKPNLRGLGSYPKIHGFVASTDHLVVGTDRNSTIFDLSNESRIRQLPGLFWADPTGEYFASRSHWNPKPLECHRFQDGTGRTVLVGTLVERTPEEPIVRIAARSGRAFMLSRSKLVRVSLDGKVRDEKPTTQELLALAVSPDERFVLVANEKRSIEVYSADSLELLGSVDGPQSGPFVPRSFEFSPDGSQLLSVSKTGETLLWDFQRLLKFIQD